MGEGAKLPSPVLDPRVEVKLLVNREVWAQSKAEAVRRGVSCSELVTEVLGEYLGLEPGEVARR